MENKQVINEVVENQVESQNQNQGNKEEKKFNENLRKLESILQGNALFKPTKIGQDSIASIVAEVTKEEQEKAQIEFKEGLKNILQKKRQLDIHFKELEQELTKKKDEKYKEFNQAINNLLAKVDNVQSIITDYTKTLENLK